MSFSIQQSLKYHLTCPKCQSSLIIKGSLTRQSNSDYTHRYSGILTYQSNLITLPLYFTTWSLSSMSETHHFTLLLDLSSLTFNIDFGPSYNEEVPIFLIHQYLACFTFHPHLWIESQCCLCRYLFGYRFCLTLNHPTNRIEEIKSPTEYLTLDTDIGYSLSLNHDTNLLTVIVEHKTTHIPNFTYSLDDPELLSIINTSLMLY